MIISSRPNGDTSDTTSHRTSRSTWPPRFVPHRARNVVQRQRSTGWNVWAASSGLNKEVKSGSRQFADDTSRLQLIHCAGHMCCLRSCEENLLMSQTDGFSKISETHIFDAPSRSEESDSTTTSSELIATTPQAYRTAPSREPHRNIDSDQDQDHGRLIQEHRP